MSNQLFLQFLPSIFVCLFSLGCAGRAHYEKVGGEWAWVGRNAAVGRHESILDVDTATFVVLDDQRYGKDRKKVFFEGGLILDAQPASFEVLPFEVGVSGRLYSKDSQHVFLKGHTVVDADPHSFQVIDAPYARDSQRVYCGTVPMDGADPKTFQLVRDCSRWVVTWNKEFFIEAEGESFDHLEVSEKRPAITSGGRWAKDANYFYSDATRVEGADYETFRPLDERRAIDKNQEYFRWRTKEEWDKFNEHRSLKLKQKAAERGEHPKARGKQTQ